MRKLAIAGMIMFTLAFGAVAQSQAQGGADAAGPSVQIYWPVAYFPALGDRLVPTAENTRALLARTGISFSIQMVPVKRAFHLYVSDDTGCITFGDGAVSQGELVSDVFFRSDFWLYARLGSGIGSLADIKTAGTIDGATKYVDFGTLPALDWTFAPTYQALLAMLASGRVDAVTLGPLIEDGTVPMPDDVIRLGTEPFITIAARLHCKPTPAARRLVDELGTLLLADREKAQETGVRN